MTFSLRPAGPDDMGLVYGSWVDSYAKSKFASSCGHAYKNIQDAIAKRLTLRSAVLVCCLADDPETIVGWACTGDGVVLYAYTKFKWRRRGVADMLLAPYLPQTDVAYTHTMTTDDKGKPWKKIPHGWQYNPALNYDLTMTA